MKIQYMIQGRGGGGDWDVDYVGSDMEANTFSSVEAAEAVIPSLVRMFQDNENPPTADDFRVVEIEE